MFSPNRTRLSALPRVVLLLLLAAGLSACSSKPASSTPAVSSPQAAVTTPTPLSPLPNINVTPSPDRKLFKTGEAVPAGYLGFKVNGSWFSDQLPAEPKPSGHFLIVDLNIVNTDRKERQLAPLKLVDEKGTEYGLTARAAKVAESAGQLGSLGPTVSRHVLAIFEAGPGHQYKLKAQGFSATDSVLIELSPAATPPAH